MLGSRMILSSTVGTVMIDHAGSPKLKKVNLGQAEFLVVTRASSIIRRKSSGLLKRRETGLSATWPIRFLTPQSLRRDSITRCRHCIGCKYALDDRNLPDYLRQGC